MSKYKNTLLLTVISFILYSIISYTKDLSYDIKEIYFFLVLYGSGMYSFISKENDDKTLLIKLICYTVFMHLGLCILI